MVTIMKPRLFVIAMSRLVYPLLGTRCGNCHSETATGPTPRSTHKFDYSPQELRSIIAWRALERQAI
jgi:hypothetical protein